MAPHTPPEARRAPAEPWRVSTRVRLGWCDAARGGAPSEASAPPYLARLKRAPSEALGALRAPAVASRPRSVECRLSAGGGALGGLGAVRRRAWTGALAGPRRPPRAGRRDRPCLWPVAPRRALLASSQARRRQARVAS